MVTTAHLNSISFYRLDVARRCPANPRIRAVTALARRRHKLNQRPRRLADRHLSRLFHRRAELQAAAKQQVIQPLHFRPLRARNSSPTKPHGIQADELVHTMDNAIRRQVHADRRTALHHRERSNATELMHETIAGDEHTVLHHHVTTEGRAIGTTPVEGL